MDTENNNPQETRKGFEEIFAGACGSRKRHDKILKASVLEAKRSQPHQSLIGFVTFLSRKLKKNETVIIGHQVANVLDKHEPEPMQKLQELIRLLPLAYRLESMPVLTKAGEPIFLVVSRHAFRVSEITRDIWKVMHPEAPQDLKDKNELVVNCTLVSENLQMMGSKYTGADLLDALRLISPTGGFFLRALYLFHANIEPKPYTDHLEAQGFHVSFILNENPSTELDPEHDFLKRLQGLLIAKSPEGLAHAMQYLEFLAPLCEKIPLPNDGLTRTGQLH